MTYRLLLKVEAERDLIRLSPEIARRILRKIEQLRNDLAGDVKRLVHYTPGLRLRVGDWRVLFGVDGDTITIWRVVHRSKAYE